MALSGRIITNAWSASSGSTWQVALDWTATQNVTNNTSTINWELVTVTGSSGYVVISELRVRFAGEQIYYRGTSSHTNGYKNTKLASGSKVVTHNQDGSLSLTATVEAGIYQWAINKSGSGTIALDTIPRASTVACSTANIGSNPTITITRASNAFTHTLTYAFGTLTGTIATKTSSTSITNWTLPTSFYGQIPNATYGTGTITCDTYNGSTKIGTKTCSFRANVANSNPVMEYGVGENNDTCLALTNDANKLIRYHSDVSAFLHGRPLNSATLKSAQIKGATKTYDFKASDLTEYTTGGVKWWKTNSVTFDNVESGTYDFTLTDSRGLSATAKKTLDVIPYRHLTCDVWQIEANTDGEIIIGASGNYFNQSFGYQHNSLTLEYRYKEGSGDWTAWSGIEYASDDEDYEITITTTGLDYQKTYTFEVRATDKLEQVVSKQLPVRCVPVFDWGEEDFNVNVNFNMNGQTVLRHNESANNVVLSASGGFIYLRPKGTNTNSVEVKITPQGNIELTGDILINGQSLKSLLGIK